MQANGPTITVGVTKVVKKSLGRDITLSSELVPFQEIDVYAKESGYVKKLLVDYGSHVKAGQVMAILEIPELADQLQQDQAEIKNASNQVTRAQHELARYQAQYRSLHLEYSRLNQVFENQPGIVAQQEVDDARGRDLAASSQVEVGQASLEASQSQLSVAKAKLLHDQSLYDYARITAPFPGVVTERYANLGTLVQAGIPSVPLQALNHEGDETTVMIVNSNGEIESRPVTLGLQTATDAEVLTGLNEGEQVVVSDRSGLKPLEKVLPKVVRIMQFHENNNNN